MWAAEESSAGFNARLNTNTLGACAQHVPVIAHKCVCVWGDWLPALGSRREVGAAAATKDMFGVFSTSRQDEPRETKYDAHPTHPLHASKLLLLVAHSDRQIHVHVHMDCPPWHRVSQLALQHHSRQHASERDQNGTRT